MNADPALWSAAELVAGYAGGSLSPVEALQAVLERACAVRGLNAFQHMDDSAFEAARRSEERWLRGRALGALDGIPLSVKDTLHVQGMPTRCGSLTTAATRSATDDPAVRSLRAAGAVLFGKTNVPEFAFKIVTESPLAGVTRNPWAPGLSAGGSSGGAAAAVAVGGGPIALGTDGGGSLRLPAAWSGVFGFKPTHDLLPDADALDFAGMCTVGPLARSVADAALVLDACVTRGAAPAGWAQRACTAGARTGLAGLRIAFSADLGLAGVEPAIAVRVAAAVALLRDRGAEVRDISAPPALAAFRSGRAHAAIFGRMAFQRVAALPPAMRAMLDPDVARLARFGSGITDALLDEALQERRTLVAGMEAFFRDHDVIVSPTFHCGPPAVPGLPPHLRAVPVMTAWCNHTGQPAASIPCGLTPEGLPVGLQVVAARGRDDLVLRVCAAYEDARGALPWPSWPDAVPG